MTNAEYQKKWRERNPEYSKLYNRNNSDKISAHSRKWYLANIEKKKAYAKEYYRKNKERILAQQKQRKTLEV